MPHYHRMPRPVEPDWCRLARAQHGVISGRQLISAGLTTAQLVTQIDKGILLRQANGVYRMSGAVASFDAALWVAVLATNGVLRATTAAFLWGLVEEHRGPIRIAISRDSRITKLPGVEIFRRDLPAESLTTRYGLPVVGRAIAILDHAVTLRASQARTVIDRAIQRNWLTSADLAERLALPHRGNTVLRMVVRGLLAGAEAESERLLHRLLRRHRIEGWRPNYPIVQAGVVRVRIDVAFLEQRLAIEVDGYAYHSKDGAFQRDRSRQNLLILLGWTVLRFTWADLTERPDYVVSTIRSALNAASGAN
jgi:very-short-patch-repair endonuclease